MTADDQKYRRVMTPLTLSILIVHSFAKKNIFARIFLKGFWIFVCNFWHFCLFLHNFEHFLHLVCVLICKLFASLKPMCGRWILTQVDGDTGVELVSLWQAWLSQLLTKIGFF